MTEHKFIAVLNKKIEVGKVMNAMAHASIGLAKKIGDFDKMGVVNYKDKGNGEHLASKYPYIILKSKNSNKTRDLRKFFIENNIPFASFTDKMTIGDYEEQLENSKKTDEKDMEYLGICAFGKKSELDEVTKKFSLWI